LDKRKKALLSTAKKLSDKRKRVIYKGI